MPKGTLFAIVLAAGESSRFGSTKQLAPFDGDTLVGRAVRTAESVCGRSSLLVVGNEWQKVVVACKPQQGFFVRNPHFRDGLASSIRCGVEAVATSADAVLLMLADQPLVQAGHLEELAARWRASPDRIVASHYSGTLGPPAIFPREFFPALCGLDGDSGAKRVLEQYADLLVTVRNDAASTDVDRPEDLDALH